MEKLQEKFNEEILPGLQKELNLKNIYQVPRIEKVVISVGIGDYKEDEAMIKKAVNLISKITGLKPKVTQSKKAVSAFKLRIGQPVGLTATLRGERAYDFLSRLVDVAIPRIRDFRGLKRAAFDGAGNYSVGIKDASIFPEVKLEDTIPGFGLQVNIRTNAKGKEKTLILLQKLGFPFEKEKYGA